LLEKPTSPSSYRTEVGVEVVLDCDALLDETFIGFVI
jgi:hypothetical protein